MGKIIHIVSQTPALKNENSVAEGVIALATEEKSIGLDVAIWCIGQSLETESSALAITIFPVHKNPFTISRSLKRALEKLPEDSIIHLHGAFAPVCFAISNYVRMSGKKIAIILSSHGAYGEHAWSRLSLLHKLYYYFFEKFVIKQARLVHLLGPLEAESYTHTNKATPFICLVDGTAGRLDNAPPSDFDGAKDPFVVACSSGAGLLGDELEGVLRTFSRFKDEVYTTVELWLVDEAADSKKTRQLADSLGVNKYIKFKKASTGQQRETVLTQSHVFAYPGRLEYTRSPVLDAASRGVPLIVNDETSLGAFVKRYQAGWTLTENNPDDLLRVLHEAYVIYKTDQETYTTLHRNSHRMVREELNPSSLALKWKEIYDSLHTRRPN